MEEGIRSFEESLDGAFGLPEKDWSQYAPLTLAYLGDAVYEVAVRTIFVKQMDIQTQKLHRKVTSCVRAQAQADMIRVLLPSLTEEEQAIYRRGRNAKPYTKAKHATMGEYLEATGFEAVIGYLYLKKENERMTALIQQGLEALKLLGGNGEKL